MATILKRRFFISFGCTFARSLRDILIVIQFFINSFEIQVDHQSGAIRVFMILLFKIGVFFVTMTAVSIPLFPYKSSTNLLLY